MAGPRSLIHRLRQPSPWGGPVTGDWRSAHFSVIDIETTGLDLRRDQIVSVGVVQVVRGRIESNRWYQVVKPSCPIKPEAMKIHSLTADELRAAPPVEDVIRELRERVAGTVLVAHAAWVERAFLDRALRPAGERLPSGMVDTAALARAAGLHAGTGHEPNLEALARMLGVPAHTPHHALGDAMTTALVLLVLASRLEQQQGHLDVRDLLDLSRANT